MDIVVQSSSWKWGYPLTASGHNQGRVCFYCIRVFNARYKCKFAISALETEMGRNIEIRNEFMAYLDTCKQIFIKAGSHDINVDWGGPSKKVVTQKQRSVASFEEPADDFWPINEYNDLVREIRKNLALVRSTVEADIKATSEFYIDHEKADAKQAKQEDVLAKTLTEWIGALPIECLRFMAGPSDGENMKGLLVFARSEQKRDDERRKVQVDEDGSESTCAECQYK